MSTEVLTSVPGNIWKVLVEVGDEVNEGDILFIVEAMKMEVEVKASASGSILSIDVQAGEQISSGDKMASIG